MTILNEGIIAGKRILHVSGKICLPFQDQMDDGNQDVVPFNKLQFFKRLENKSSESSTRWKQNNHGISKERSKYKDKIGTKVLVIKNGICGTTKYLGCHVAGGNFYCGIEMVIFVIVLILLYYRNYIRIGSFKFLRIGKYVESLVSTTVRLDFSVSKFQNC